MSTSWILWIGYTVRAPDDDGIDRSLGRTHKVSPLLGIRPATTALTPVLHFTTFQVRLRLDLSLYLLIAITTPCRQLVHTSPSDLFMSLRSASYVLFIDALPFQFLTVESGRLDDVDANLRIHEFIAEVVQLRLATLVVLSWQPLRPSETEAVILYCNGCARQSGFYLFCCNILFVQM